MKKYHQLLLLIISVISLSLFLIYRHEYNRLHYVLEVFNFFGQPCNFSDLQKTENILSQHDWGPQPLWQDSNNGYIYSAFLTGKLEAKTIVLQTDIKSIPRNCYFWFEEKKKPILGKFKYSKLNNEETDNVFFYMCTLPNIENVPYAISFSFKLKRENDMKKIMLTNTLGHSNSINSTLCVSPSIYSKKKLLEFISFHKVIGIDSFIFYDKDIPYRISKLLINLSSRLGIQVSFLPWNYPKAENTERVRSLVENDCLLRTSGRTKFVITLETNEYLVPMYHINFDQLVKTFESDKISLPVQKFCIDYIDMKKPLALQNFQVSDDHTFNTVRYIHRNSEKSDVMSTNAVDKGMVSVHKYVRCNLNPQKTHTDKNMIRYGTDFTRSTLVQLLLHDQI